MKTKTGTITATGSSHAITLSPDQTGPDSEAVIAVGGTFTGATIVADKLLPGGTLRLPLVMINEATYARNNGTATPADSTATSYRVSIGAAKEVRVYASAGTGLSMTVEMASGKAAEFGGPVPILNTVITGSETHSDDVSLVDSVKLIFGTGSDVSFKWDGTDLIVAQALADSVIKWGVSGAGINHVFYGDTATRDASWDQSNDQLLFNDNAKLAIGTGAGAAGDITFTWDGTDLLVAQLTADSNIKWGVSGAGINHIFYGDTALRNMSWDQTNDQLLFEDNTKLAIGAGAGGVGDIALSWDATRLNVTQLTADSEVRWGVDGAGIDQMWYGDTASAYANWDQSADCLIFGGVARIQGAVVKTNGATAITTTRAVTRADSGGVFTVAQSSAYTVTVATPTQAGERYLFQCVSPGSFDVSIVATGCTFEGSITIDAATVVATGSTLKFASAAALLGDSIELVATSTSKFLVRAFASGAGGITIT